MVTKASFQGCALEDRENFKNSQCIMPVSLGAKNHEGERLLATLHLVNKSFKECTILIDDSIQRHTKKLILFEQNDKILYQQALKDGDDWLARNQHYFSEIFLIPHKVLRWDHWLNHEGYAAAYETVCMLFEKDEYYRQAFYLAAHAFLLRQRGKLKTGLYDEQARKQICIDYLKEECAVMLLWCTVGGYDFELYPSGRNSAMTVTYELLIKPFFPDKLKIVGVRFKKF